MVIIWTVSLLLAPTNATVRLNRLKREQSTLEKLRMRHSPVLQGGG
jgi:hypothetical protein